MDWFEAHNGFIMAISVLVYAIISIFLLKHMGKSDKISKELERSRLRPIVSIRLGDACDGTQRLFIKNSGLTPAFDVIAEYSPNIIEAIWGKEPPKNAPSPRNRENPFTRTSIGMLAPGQEINRLISTNARLISKASHETFEGQIRYNDGLGKHAREYKEKIIIDLTHYKEQYAELEFRV
ncbi:MAG TPA: hypothetical protein VM163_01710 [bacterium]|nr:hypothetical protein [bacterium]